MDADSFRRHGREMVDYVASYMENIAQRPPLHSVTPGYLRQLIPDEAPDMPETYQDVMKDIERVIMPGVTHWHNPHFHAYFPTGNSFPSILADMLSDAIGCIGFTWNACPACTELEVSMMDWLAKMLQMPKEFLFSEAGPGGGVIQPSASDATLVAILSARTAAGNRLRESNPDITQGQIIDKLVAYCSEDAHSSVKRAGLIAFVKMRDLPSDEKGSLRGATLEAAIREDKAMGLVPFFCCATVGTTSACSFDNLEELGPVCNANDMWMHVDAAYAGSACICPEFRYLLNGVEHCMSFNFNPHKWMNVVFDCSVMWVKDSSMIAGAFETNPLYLKHQHQNNANSMPDYRHWQTSLGRRFRSLKLWFVIRMFGVEKLQANIRKDVRLAKQFEALVRKNDRFEIIGHVTLGLVCFRLKGSDAMNEKLHDLINADHRIHLVPSCIKSKYTLRFAVCASSTQESDVTFAWNAIQEIAGTVKED